MIRFSTLFLILLSACSVTLEIEDDGRTIQKEFKRSDILDQYEEVISTSTPRTEERKNQHCSHYDYCFSCMPGFDGQMSCGMKFSAFCDGSRDTIVELTDIDYKIVYKVKDLGKVKSPVYRRTNEILIKATECH